MKNCLIVFHPREIKKAIDSIKALPIDKVFFKGYYTKQLKQPIMDFIKKTSYDNYIFLADDVIVEKKSLEIVESFLEKYDIFTGYCRMCVGSDIVNLCDKPLTLSGKYPLQQDYSFMNIHDVEKYKDSFQTYIGGMALTGMRRNICLKYPIDCYLTKINDPKGVSMDHHLSYRLQKNNIKIMTHKDAYITHLKNKLVGPLMQNWIVGKIKPQIIFEKYIPPKN